MTAGPAPHDQASTAQGGADELPLELLLPRHGRVRGSFLDVLDEVPSLTTFDLESRQIVARDRAPRFATQFSPFVSSNGSDADGYLLSPFDEAFNVGATLVAPDGATVRLDTDGLAVGGAWWQTTGEVRELAVPLRVDGGSQLQVALFDIHGELVHRLDTPPLLMAAPVPGGIAAVTENGTLIHLDGDHRQQSEVVIGEVDSIVRLLSVQGWTVIATSGEIIVVGRGGRIQRLDAGIVHSVLGCGRDLFVADVAEGRVMQLSIEGLLIVASVAVREPALLGCTDSDVIYWGDEALHIGLRDEVG